MKRPSVDAKQTQLQLTTLRKGKYIAEYCSRILGLIAELKNAGYAVSEISKSGHNCEDYRETIK